MTAHDPSAREPVIRGFVPGPFRFRAAAPATPDPSGRPTPRPVLGILGGMGPVASAEFLRSVYRQAAFRREQEAPACVLLSDPAIPDRTEAIREGREAEILGTLVAGLERLEAAGATRTLAACVTLHHWVPALPPERRRTLISLVDVVVDELRRAPGRTLLLCTSGARAARVFERHPAWDEVADTVVFPGERDQARVHRWIFALKAHRRPRAVLEGVERLRARHGAARWVAACTELHIAANALRARGRGDAVLDPLHLVATRLDRYMTDAAAPAGRAAALRSS